MRRLVRHARGVVATGLILTTLASSALGQVPPADKARAEILFNEGRASIGRGNFTDACPKFEESQRLDPAVGTLINLAECHEHEARLVSAWNAYREAATLAAQRKDLRRQKYAEEHAAALEPKLSHVTIVASGEGGVGGGGGNSGALVVKRDGEPVDATTFNTAIPIDSGHHTIDASEPGKKPWSTTIDLEPGKDVRVEIPSLVPETPTAVQQPQENVVTTKSGFLDERTLAYIVGGVGVVALGVGTWFALSAQSKWNDVSAVCPNGHCPDAETRAAQDPSKQDASRDATISTIGFVAGGLALAAGTALFVLSMRGKDTTAKAANTAKAAKASSTSSLIAPTLAPHATGLVVSVSLQ